MINDLDRRLQPEARIRALANRAAPKNALQEFQLSRKARISPQEGFCPAK